MNKTRSIFLKFITDKEKDKFVEGMQRLLPNATNIKDLEYFKEVEIECSTFEEVEHIELVLRRTSAYKRKKFIISYVCSRENEQKLIKKLQKL